MRLRFANLVIAFAALVSLSSLLVPARLAAERIVIGTPSRGFEFPVVVAMRQLVDWSLVKEVK